jgi:hypothetical protein
VDSIRVKEDGDSKEIDESESQHAKHSRQRISTRGGMTMDSSEEEENACGSIDLNDDGDSNDICSMDLF